MPFLGFCLVPLSRWITLFEFETVRKPSEAQKDRWKVEDVVYTQRILNMHGYNAETNIT